MDDIATRLDSLISGFKSRMFFEDKQLMDIKRSALRGWEVKQGGEDGEFKQELASRVRSLLGPKKNFTAGEIDRAVSLAFDEYKKEFKERTVKLA